VRAAQGELRPALDTLLACRTWIQNMNAPNPASNAPWRSDAALLAAQLGEEDLAHDLLGEELELARAFGAPIAIAIALRAEALMSDGDARDETLAEAVSLLDGTVNTLELARTLTEQGAALRRSGRRGDALAPLRRGLDLAARCGALGLTRRAREELVAAGARPRRQRLWGTDALTASELRVARMAAQGMSNPQIAQALFITRKTVTVHLTRIYQKLDITSRAQLADSLGERRDRQRPVPVDARH
jgi:DNA-binding CsgD family transcriptional regulator